MPQLQVLLSRMLKCRRLPKNNQENLRHRRSVRRVHLQTVSRESLRRATLRFRRHRLFLSPAQARLLALACLLLAALRPTVQLLSRQLPQNLRRLQKVWLLTALLRRRPVPLPPAVRRPVLLLPMPLRPQPVPLPRLPHRLPLVLHPPPALRPRPPLRPPLPRLLNSMWISIPSPQISISNRSGATTSQPDIRIPLLRRLSCGADSGKITQQG